MLYQSPDGCNAGARRGYFRATIWIAAALLTFVQTFASTGYAAVEERKSLKLAREIRPLAGGLDQVPVFNSNCPEIVGSDGILLSTFPRQLGSAHIDYAFNGRFDVFAHHIASSAQSGRKEDLYLGLLVGNATERPVAVEVLSAATYLSRPDAPFVSLPPLVENDQGNTFAGPGDRVTNELLRKRAANKWQRSVTVYPGQQVLLHSFAIPVSRLKPQLNGRTYMAQLESDGPVRLALVACFAHPRKRLARLLTFIAPLPLIIRKGRYRAPSEEEFIAVLNRGQLVAPREKPPSPPDDRGPIRYGRVSGVALGSNWQATLTDKDKSYLALPVPEKPVSYVLSALRGGTFGTGQIQSAPLVVRYEDTAYQAHGNYGVKYDLTFPFKNTSDRPLNLHISLETPVKSDARSDAVTFSVPPSPQIYFRGTIKVSLASNDGESSARYYHIVQHRAEMGEPFLTLPMAAGQEQTVHVEFFYPPDCTPPQLLTVSTTPASTN